QPAVEGGNLDTVARDYLVLELAMGLHDDNHVDAWFGPQELEQAAEEERLSLARIHDRASVMAERLHNWPAADGESEEALRVANLLGRLRALMTRIDINQGHTASFDEESRRLFGATAPDYDAAHFVELLEKIDELLPGSGDLSERVNEFQSLFIIPADRIPDVFDAAIAECRRRTLEHIELPDNESFRLEYVTDKPWSGYNWYEGNAQSLIQINTGLPIFIHRAVDLGCHEGYPGHHTYNTLLERDLVLGKGWVEFTLYPLFSPQSLIAEGSGNYGIQLAFPGDERIEFEKRVLFPLAGLEVADAERFYALQALLEQLSYAGNEAARDYLNGDIDREAAAKWLVDYALSSPERALQRVDFFDTYRSYVINYNLGEDLVRDYIERGTSSPAERWQRFSDLISSPMQPSDLD
ncbi:MAG TPA: hypothetical protein VF389_09560, partial [Woeseiaceae bacterium]